MKKLLICKNKIKSVIKFGLLVFIVIIAIFFGFLAWLSITIEKPTIEEWYHVYGKLEVIYVDNSKDVVVYEIVIESFTPEHAPDEYIKFPQKHFDETNWTNAGYKLIVEDNTTWEYIFNHTLIDIQPNSKLDTGDCLYLYQKSKYAGKIIRLTASGFSRGMGFGEFKGVVPYVPTYQFPEYRNITPQFKEEIEPTCFHIGTRAFDVKNWYPSTQRPSLHGFSCWEWFVKRMGEYHNAIHFSQDAKEPEYRPYGAYGNENEVPLKINYRFSFVSATGWMNPNSTFDVIYDGNSPDFDVTTLMSILVVGM